MRSVIAFTVSLLCLTACDRLPTGMVSAESTTAPAAKTRAQLVVGSWEEVHSEAGVTLRANCNYAAGGRFRVTGTITGFGSQTFECAGTWKIDGDTFITRVDSSTLPGLIPVGSAYGDQIVSLSETDFIYVDGKTHETTACRRIS